MMPLVESAPTAAGPPRAEFGCPHRPRCPGPEAADREAARVVASQPLQGWSLLCNGVVVFDDTGELLPDGRAVAPRRRPAPHWHAAAHRQ